MTDRTALAELWLARAPGLVSLALVVAIGLLLGQLAWHFIPAPEPGQVYVGPAASAQPSAPRADDSARRAGLAVALFGEPSRSAPEPVEEKVAVATVTQLDLKLRGVAASANPDDALAIIEGPDGTSLPYRIGDLLSGDAELIGVANDRVTLRRGAVNEILLFSEEAGTATRIQPSLARPVSSAPAADGSGPVQLKPESSARLREYLGALPNDPAKMTELVRALPVMQNGQLQGFRLFPGRQRDLFSEVGLRRGDIVTQVNGMPLNDPARGMELLTQLPAASQVTLEIIRRGRPQTLHVQL